MPELKDRQTERTALGPVAVFGETVAFAARPIAVAVESGVVRRVAVPAAAIWAVPRRTATPEPDVLDVSNRFQVSRVDAGADGAGVVNLEAVRHITLEKDVGQSMYAEGFPLSIDLPFGGPVSVSLPETRPDPMVTVKCNTSADSFRKRTQIHDVILPLGGESDF